MCESRTTLIKRLENTDDPHAWEEFVDLYGATIFTWGKRLGLQDVDAEDLTQEAFRRVVRSLPTYDRARGRFRGWLYTIVRNEFLKWREKKHRNPTVATDSAAWKEATDESASESAAWNDAYETHLLRSALDRLRLRMNPNHWQIFWETEFEERSPQEAAEANQVSVGSVYVVRSRAIARLKEAVAELEREAEQLCE